MKLLDDLGYRVLCRLKPPSDFKDGPEVFPSYVERITDVIGEDGWNDLRGQTVLDFGCACGAGTIEMAQHGARHVIGLDIRQDALAVARAEAEAAGVSDCCVFTSEPTQEVDCIVSLDAFEHFDDPAGVLVEMHRLLKVGGRVILSFGPTWFHPYGGHLLSVFPWSHLVLSETAQMRWRSEFKRDGATRIRDVDGGMNQLSIRHLLRIIHQSPFEVERQNLVPIRPLAWAQNPLTREFTTSVVQCILRKS